MIRITVIFICAILPLTAAIADGEFRWEDVAPLNNARMSHGAAVFDGRIYVFGGRSHHRMQVLSSIEVYDPEQDRWRELGPLPRPLCSMAAAVGGEAIYLFGGLTTRNEPVNWVLRFDPRENSTRFIDTLAYSVHSLSSVEFDHRILVMGGISPPLRFLSTGFWYDPRRLRKTDAPAFNVARSNYGMIFNRTVWAVGGITRGGPVATTEVIVNNRWRLAGRMPSPRGELGTAVFGDTLVIAGGFNEREQLTNRVDGFIIGQNQWVELPPMSDARAAFPLVSLGDRLYAVGGRTTRRNGHVTAGVEMFRYHELNDAAPPETAPLHLELVTVWPNPTNGIVNFNLPCVPASIKIVDVRGHVVSEAIAGDRLGRWSWNSASFPGGAYLFVIHPAGGSTVSIGRFAVVK